MIVPEAHKPNFPWRIDRLATIVDCTGMPVAMGLYYTSVRSSNPDGSEVIYNRSDYAGPIRAKFMVAAINKAAKEAGLY